MGASPFEQGLFKVEAFSEGGVVVSTLNYLPVTI
jgi:hypothetical protein